MTCWSDYLTEWPSLFHHGSLSSVHQFVLAVVVTPSLFLWGFCFVECQYISLLYTLTSALQHPVCVLCLRCDLLPQSSDSRLVSNRGPEESVCRYLGNLSLCNLFQSFSCYPLHVSVSLFCTPVWFDPSSGSFSPRMACANNLAVIMWQYMDHICTF